MQFRDLKERNKIIVMAALFSGACFLTYYYHAILNTDVIFTHLFYIPIMLASIWWKRRGIAAAVLLGLLLLVSHVLFAPDLPLVPDLYRAAMFIVIASAVALLSEQTATAVMLYKTLAGGSHTGVYILQDGKLKYLNQRAIEYAGFSEGELMQMSPLDWVHPDDKEEAQKNAIQMLKGVRKAPYEFRVFARDGKMKWILETVTPIQFRGRKAVLGNAMDITDHKRAEESVKNANQRFSEVLNSLDALVYVTDMETHELLFINKYGQDIWGDIEGKICWQTIQEGQDGPCEFCTNNKLVDADGKPTGVLVWEFQNTVNKRWYECRDRAIYWPDGRVVRIEIASDITERKQAEDALRQSEEKHRTILENIEDGYHEVDLGGSFTFFNESFRKMMGYTSDELMGMNYRNYAADEENARKIFLAYNKVYKTGRPIRRFEWDIIRKDGERRTIDVSASLIRDAEDQPTGFRGIVRDTTERMLAERELRESENKYNELAHSLPQIIFEADRKGNLTFVNNTAYSMSGYSPEDFERGLNALQMLVPEDRERAGLNMQHIMQGEEIQGNEYTFRRKDGRTFPVITESTPIVRNNQTVGLRGIIIDVSERKQLESQLSQARKMESLGQLASGAAHEIRNPLNIMSLWLQMLDVTGKALDDDVRKAIDTCNNQIRRIIRVLEGLQEFSRMPLVEKRLDDLNKIIGGVVDSFDAKFKNEGITAEIRGGEGIPSFMLDKEKIAMVITHLISNAVDAMKDRETKRLGISTEKTSEGKSVRIVVSDTGHGISETDKARIFDPFFTTKDPDKGKGLGLSISYGIIRDHGGTIRAENNEQSGATFIIELPV